MGPKPPGIEPEQKVELEFSLPPCNLSAEDLLSIISIGAPSSLDSIYINAQYVNISSGDKKDKRKTFDDREFGYPYKLLETGFPKRTKTVHWIASGMNESVSFFSFLLNAKVRLQDTNEQRLKEKEARIKKLALKRLRKNPLPYLSLIPMPIYGVVALVSYFILLYLTDVGSGIALIVLWGVLFPPLLTTCMKTTKFISGTKVKNNETE